MARVAARADQQYTVPYAENARGFGMIGEYNQRANVKMSGTHLIPQKPQFFVSPSRPGNFGDHIDFKCNIDNWYNDNRY
jgi:ubiquinol-cytochrome c reductase iron-sulfur subunit